MQPDTPDTDTPARAQDACTLETALADLPVGCTLMIYRTAEPNGYRIVLRDDMPLRSWEAGYIADVQQVGEIVHMTIEMQHGYEQRAARNWQHNHTQHVAVSPETKQRLMDEYGLTEADFEVQATPPAASD